MTMMLTEPNRGRPWWRGCVYIGFVLLGVDALLSAQDFGLQLLPWLDAEQQHWLLKCVFILLNFPFGAGYVWVAQFPDLWWQQYVHASLTAPLGQAIALGATIVLQAVVYNSAIRAFSGANHRLDPI